MSKLRHTNQKFYQEVGRSLRASRLLAGKSQMESAEKLGITFQQFQKYESGANRIPLDRLLQISVFLKIPVLNLISFNKSIANNEISLDLLDKIHSKEFLTLLHAWTKIKDKKIRAALLGTIKSMSELDN